MYSRKSIQTISLLSALFFLFAGNGFGQIATLKNAGFETYNADAGTFADWSFDKDSTGGELYIISQDTDSAHSGTGCLKMEITAPLDTSDEAPSHTISGAVSNLPTNKLFTITAWVKYSEMPVYWNGMFNLQQATLKAPDWNWIDREWLSMWGNDPGTVSSWTEISMTGTSADSANVFNLIISLAKGGTLWVDDIAITYTDPVPITEKTVQPGQWGSILNNRITFSRPTSYSLEAFGVNGKALLRQSGIAEKVDLNRIDAGCGAYLFRVKTGEKVITSRAVIVK
ncbi:MAG: hypothetical protein JXA18_07760 [Chitinispirillaceae bacterium]|nr:hypothetical protein [Chitinispirillaceae bacterium]